MANNPLQQMLEDIGKFRGQINTQLLRTPAPDPARKTLQSVDHRMSKLESEIRSKLG
jgi:hypothetical protein